MIPQQPKEKKLRRLNLHADTHEVFDNLAAEFKRNDVDSDTIKRIALAKGIKHMPVDYVLKPKDIAQKAQTTRLEIIENDFFDAVIRQKNQIPHLTKELKKDLYERYLEYGAILLRQELEEEVKSSHLLFNFYRYNVPKSEGMSYVSKHKQDEGVIPIIELYLGTNEDGEPVFTLFNDKGNAGFHMGIIGTTGSGKTQLALRIASQIYKQSKNTNIIFLDYAKGDVAKNHKFINDLSSIVIDVAKDGIPFNPLNLEKVGGKEIQELKELFVSNQSRIGSAQKMELYDVLEALYEKMEVPDFGTLYEELREYYESRNKGANVLVELFHALSISEIFPSTNSEELFSSFMNENIIFDLSGIDQTMRIKELVTFFVLHRIYSEAISKKDSRVDSKTGMQEIRTVVFIDEGHNYMASKNPILEKMLRELRSVGVSVVIMSQDYTDFRKSGFDYTSLMNWTFYMKQKISEKHIAEGLSVPRRLMENMPNFSDLDTHCFYSKKLSEKDDYVTFIKGEGYND
ncbi:helicase HerA domain-containing protein [Peribacillus frigoritolerans]|uniref:helicase HerA domain-containing protein n=1 Tax=Peribacillus frigoritolerans TaxID=450367 RepID=UPI0037F2B4D7